MNRSITRNVLLGLTIGMTALSACSSSNNSSPVGAVGQGVTKIGIIQIVQHPSLDSIRETIVKRLEEKGYKDGSNIEIDYENAQGDQAILKTISQKFVSNKYDLIVAIATPSAQTVAAETSEIPIVFAACTDPVASGLVPDMDKPGGNITGTSDIISAEKNMILAKRIFPSIKTVGVLYNSSETSSQLVLKDLRNYAKNNELKLIEKTVTSTSEVQQAALSLVGKVDIIFTPTDNTIATSMPLVSQVAIDAKIPLFAGADSMVKDGGLAGSGVNYVNLGVETGDMVIEVLKGTTPGDLPVRVMNQMNTYVNKQTADKLGITIPESVLKEAAQLFEN